MDKKLFEEKLQQVGNFKIGSFQEIIFIPRQGKPICSNCDTGSYINIERRWGYKDRPYWHCKCSACRKTWQKSTFTNA